MGDVEIQAFPYQEESDKLLGWSDQEGSSWIEIVVAPADASSKDKKDKYVLGYIDAANVQLNEPYAKRLLDRVFEVATCWSFGHPPEVIRSGRFITVYKDGEFCNVDSMVEELMLAKDQPEGHIHREHFSFGFSEWFSPARSCELMRAMWEKRQFSDMVLVCNSRKFACHREVLSAVSPVFELMMTSRLREGLEQIVEIKDFTPDVVVAFLEYVYLGDLPKFVSSGIVEGILCMSDMYDVPALSERCAKFLLDGICHDHVVSVLHTLGKLSEANASARSAFHLALQRIRYDSSLLHTVCMYPSRHGLHGCVKATGTDADTGPMKVEFSSMAIASVAAGEIESCAESFHEAELDSSDNTEGPEHDHNNIAPTSSPRGLDFLPLPASGGMNFVSDDAFVDQLEPSAVIPEAEAALIEQERWATMVEQRIARETTTDQNSQEHSPQTQVVVLSFQRNIRGMAQALVNSEFGGELAAGGLDMQPAWANGATIMVQGLTYEKMMAQSSMPVAKLRPWHVVVCEEDEAMVLQALSSFSYRQRPRPRESKRINLTLLDMQPASEDFGPNRPETEVCSEMVNEASPTELAIEVQRTFIHFSEIMPQSPRTSVTY